ncbi:hypothetical protein [Streptomyces sp. NPDC059092]
MPHTGVHFAHARFLLPLLLRLAPTLSRAHPRTTVTVLARAALVSA